MPRQIEDAHQIALFEWAYRMTARHPELALLHAIPNGGLRHKAVAGKLKAMGVKAGVPDIMLPVACAGLHGLYIELKTPPSGKTKAGRTSDSQKSWHVNLREQGYRVVVAFGWDQASRAILDYLAAA